MKQPHEEMLEELEHKLLELSQSSNTRLDQCTKKVRFCQRLIIKFKNRYRSATFDNPGEEITFFKKVKPRFMSELYYQMEVFKFLQSEPLGSTENKKSYINKKLNKASSFIKKHSEFHTYIKMGYDHLDHLYFTRQDYDPVIHGRLEFPTDTDFCTPADSTLTCLYSCDRLIHFLREELSTLENPKKSLGPSWESSIKLKWNKSKTDLVELIYSLYASNSIIGELKDLIHMMEKMFKVDLGNFYRTYTDIKYKKNPTSFIDDLKTSLLQKISEENQKK